MISIFFTQLSKQPELIEIYDCLLSIEGAEIYIKPFSNFLENPNGEYTFADLILSYLILSYLILSYLILSYLIKATVQRYCDWLQKNVGQAKRKW